MKKPTKLNLDDITFDGALGGTSDEPGPEGMVLSDDPTKAKGDETNVADEAEDTADADDSQGSDDDSVGTTDGTSDEDDVEELTLVSEIKGKIGFDIEGEFEDTPEGLLELTKAASSKIAETQLQELFSSMPDVEQYLKYRLNGGDSAQFFQTFYGDVDYGTLKLEENDVVTQEHLVRQAMVLKGFEADDIQESIQEFKNSGLLHSQASKALKGLTKHQAAERQNLVEQQEREALDSVERNKAYWTSVQKTLTDSNEFRGIPISEKEKSEMLQYLSQPVKDGLSAFQVAMNEAPVDVVLAIAALMKRNFNLDGLVTRKAKTEQAKGLREQLSKNRERAASKASRAKGTVDKPDFASLDLSL